MPTNKQMRDFMRREVQSRKGSIVGTVITKPELKFFNGSSAETYVADVTVGSNRDLRNVPIKAGPGGGIDYAGLGQTVRLDRNGEKFQVVGPGDRVVGDTVVKTYNVGVAAPVTTATEGQGFQREPYEFYKGDLPGTPGSGLYGIQVGYALVRKTLNGVPV